MRPGRLGPGPFSELAVGEVAERGGGLVGLVDHGHPVGVHLLGPVEEVTNAQSNLHARTVPPAGPTRRAAGPGVRAR